MLEIIAKPFGMLLLWFYNLVGNYGIAIFLFTVVVKLIMLPFQYKSQKGMMRMQALNPQIQELQKRHEGNQQRLQQEISKLYKEEKVNPMSGCLWMLIPYPILIALYYAIRYPLTTMMGVSAELIAEGGAIYAKLGELGFDFSSTSAAYIQLRESQFISAHFAEFQPLSERLVNINYSFLGLNLADTPTLFFWNSGISWASIGLFLIPVVSAFLSWLQMKLGQATNPSTAGAGASAQQSQQSMKTMNLMMPLMSLWICFSMPAAMGIYWIFTSLLAIVQSLILNKHFAQILAAETAEREARQRERQAELDRKREETERLRAEGLTRENTSTSKKKQQARQKAELDELRAAAIREERAAKRARKGIVDAPEEIPASQVGTRRYARGRAYVPDRFTNPEHAAEATAAAAAESENWDAAAEAETEGSSDALPPSGGAGDALDLPAPEAPGGAGSAPEGTGADADLDAEADLDTDADADLDDDGAAEADADDEEEKGADDDDTER